MKQWFQNISANLFSGFVVSLIALPLSLGLAMAAGAPPMAGIIAAVVGGVFVSLLGGSYVTVAGPGNGLVVATLGAISVLGQGDPQMGFLYALAAIVVSGVVIFLLGLFKVGVIGDFFPSAAVQGMLAAIGLIIVSKQLHIMLGVMSPQAQSATALYALLPDTLQQFFAGELNALAWIVGLGSLLILIAHSFIKSGFLKQIPAPVLAVGFGIGINALAMQGSIDFIPLSEAYLIQLPADVLGQMAVPNFDKALSYDFFMAVFALTFIATTETLLSIKAVDKLDPKKRRSNVNKDLRAVGAATVVSGMLGGLNPVIAIARSSVNVNNGATWRSANLFHALFLAAFIFFFSGFLNRIPLPALAAILVFTGYRLASPRVFKKIGSVGLEQLTIFAVTLGVTLFTDLIMGMASGMLLTLLLQINTKDRGAIILRNFFKPNTLLFVEDSGKYHLSVRAYSNFVNFVKLKKKLESIPPNATVIVDFSLTRFVDYTVMEQLQGYADYFEKFNGSLEVIGLDDLTAQTAHPLAPRKVPHTRLQNRKSRRQEAILEYFDQNGWKPFNKRKNVRKLLLHCNYFADKSIDKVRNSAYLESEGGGYLSYLDVDFHEGELLTLKQYHSSIVVISLDVALPRFVLDKENLLHRTAVLAGLAHTQLEEFPDFNANFKVKTGNETALKELFTPELVAFFESRKPYHIESYGKQVLVFEKERQATLSEFKQLVSFAADLFHHLQNKSNSNAQT